MNDPALRERAALAEAECALAAGQPTQAEAALKVPLTSKDDARRSRAELLAGQTAALRLDHVGAIAHFERSRETAALPGRAAALIAADRATEAAAAIEALTDPHFAVERVDLLARLASAAGSSAASAALDRLLARGKGIPFQEQARLLIADADRHLAQHNYEEAAARYRRAAAVAPAATTEAGMAATGALRVQIAGVQDLEDLKPIEAELRRVSSTPGGAAAKPLLDILRQAMSAGETPASGFRAAELARDSLKAPGLAGALFLAFAARDTASLYAPKALVAAVAMLPARRDSIVAVLDTRYATSPYTRAFHGEPSVAYAAAEDSLARDLGLQMGRSTLSAAAGGAGGGRVELPVPGPRGPKLDEPREAEAVRARPLRPGNRPGAPPPPPPPPPVPAPDRP